MPLLGTGMNVVRQGRLDFLSKARYSLINFTKRL